MARDTRRNRTGEYVLIAEDSRIQAEQLCMILDEHDYVYRIAGNGREALTMAEADPPDVIISDVNMPEMDGYELCRQLKLRPSLRDIPLILVTSLSSAQDVLRGLECGADNFIIKPYDEDSLLIRIRYLLTNRTLREQSHVRTGIEIDIEGKRHFVTAERHQILDLLVSTYASAVRLADEAARRGEQLRESYETMAVLHRCAEHLNRLRTEPEIVRELLERLLDLPFVRGSWLWLLDHDGGVARTEALGVAEDWVAAFAKTADCSCRAAQHRDAAMTAANIERCERLAPFASPDNPFIGHATVPLRGDGQPLGLLNVLHSDGRLFSHEELRVMEALASQAASALERARLYATLETRVAERTAELRRSQDHLALAQQIGSIGSVDVDLATGRGHWTDNNFHIYGLAPSSGPLDLEQAMSFTHPEDRERHREQFRHARLGLESEASEFRIIRTDGQLRWVRRRSAIVARDQGGKPSRMLVTMQDITEAKKAEAEKNALQGQLAHVQKMEAVGNLTGGIAHDFNNILAVAIGNLDLLKMEVPPSSEADTLVETALSACLKGSELTKSLLAFSRRQPLQPKRVTINQLLRDNVKMLSRAIGERIEVQLKLGEALWDILIDPSQLESALLNMIVNARDAMPDGGRIIVETRNTCLDQTYADQNAEVVPGDYVALELSDTGHGMPPEVISRVFEPFFTTKEKGKGTGLGLAMVFGFVKQSGGHIKIYSEVGHGTTIRLYLPRAAADAAHAETQGSNGPVSAVACTEAILVVEDNSAVRRTVVKQLRHAGYRVIDAEDGERALELIENNDADVDMVLSDVVMPGRYTGPDLVREIMRRWPRIKVLLTSGFPEGLIAGRNGLPDDIMLLSKPYRTEELLRKLREVLDAR